MRSLEDAKLAVIGLGYVGLPLAIEFGKRFDTLGFDIDPERIDELLRAHDRTLEAEPTEFANAKRLSFSADAAALNGRDVFIVTVPTPINEHKHPDFTPLIMASRTIGKVLKAGGLVIYESTVYPGATEEICVPELERISGLRFNIDFAVGYSPERINPGDKDRRLTKIKKVTSGSTPESADVVDALYRSIITAGTHKATSIKVAEASKVIENTQRDANIALVNEFSMIFQRLGIDTIEVLAAAGTKWNFLPFKPGLVGGHCIGVDPYYLIQKAQSVGYYPDVLIAARRINDAMGKNVAAAVVKLLIRKNIKVSGARVLVLGFTFKENCPDLRNTRVIDVVRELEEFGARVDVHDPWADAAETRREYGVEPIARPLQGEYDAIIVAVAHDQFQEMGGEGVRAYGKPEGSVVYDVRSVLPREFVDGRL